MIIIHIFISLLLIIAKNTQMYPINAMYTYVLFDVLC